MRSELRKHKNHRKQKLNVRIIIYISYHYLDLSIPETLVCRSFFGGIGMFLFFSGCFDYIENGCNLKPSTGTEQTFGRGIL